MKTHLRLRVSCALLALAGAAGTAEAQDATPDTAATEPAAGSSDDAGASSGGAMGDIVVTATRRSESLQKVPIAISAFTGESLETSRVESIKDLDVTTTGLTASSAGVGVTPYLRGVGSSDATPGQETPIAIYIDGVYQPTVWTNSVPFSNIERVEVLKGPQGTLFGRNATGGLIHIITKDPGEELGGNATVAYGNYDTITAKAYVEGGIADGITADIAGYYNNQRDGWGKNLFTGNDIYKGESYALRSKWIFKPGDRAKITIVGDYRHEDSSTGYNYRQVPGSIAADGSTATPGYYDNNSNIDFHLKSEVWSVSGKVEYEFDAFTFTSLTSYQQSRVDTDFDNDATPSYTVHANTRAAVNDTFQQEVQLASASDSSFRWIAGLYFMDMTGGFGGKKGIQLYGDGVIPGGLGVDIRNVIKTRSYAAFAELGFDLGESTRLTVGGRYTRDERRLVGTTTLDAAPPGQSPIAVIGTVDTEKTFSQPTWRVILDHDLAQDVLVYASYSRGFKSGNFNALNPANPPFKPEKLTSYEIGFKSRLLDRTLQLNGAAFYYDYANLQLVENRGNISNTVNAAQSTIKGFELDAIISPVSDFSVRAGFTYLDGKYDDFPAASCFAPKPGGGNVAFACDASGLPIVRTPKYSVNLSADYTIPTEIGDFRFNATYYYNSGLIYSPESRLKQKAYDVLNGTIGWEDANSGLRVSVFGKNILDKKYSNYIIAQELGDTQVAAPPRTYGVELGVRF